MFAVCSARIALVLHRICTDHDNVVHFPCVYLDLVRFSETDCCEGLTVALILVLIYEIILKSCDAILRL
jgi:hypothetical protein